MDSEANSILLPSRAPFSFGLSLAYLQRRPGELVDTVDRDVYRRLLITDGKPLLVEARSAQTAPILAVRLLSGDTSKLPQTADSLRRGFGLEDDLDLFRLAVRDDPQLTGLIDQLEGLRLLRTPSPFEALIWAIIGQQINLTFAFRLKAALVRAYGDCLTYEGKTFFAFPQPERLAGVDPRALMAFGFNARKAETVVAVAGRIAANELDLAGLRSCPRDEAVAKLTAFPGVGPWTAHYTLLRGLGDFGAFPAADLGLRGVAARMYGGGSPAPPALMRELAARWGEWRGYAAFYLWNASSAVAA